MTEKKLTQLYMEVAELLSSVIDPPVPLGRFVRARPFNRGTAGRVAHPWDEVQEKPTLEAAKELARILWGAFVRGRR